MVNIQTISNKTTARKRRLLVGGYDRAARLVFVPSIAEEEFARPSRSRDEIKKLFVTQGAAPGYFIARLRRFDSTRCARLL